jgi:hypothetical protein
MPVFSINEEHGGMNLGIHDEHGGINLVEQFVQGP